MGKGGRKRGKETSLVGYKTNRTAALSISAHALRFVLLGNELLKPVTSNKKEGVEREESTRFSVVPFGPGQVFISRVQCLKDLGSNPCSISYRLFEPGQITLRASFFSSV